MAKRITKRARAAFLARVIEANASVRVEDHLYDLGYWARCGGIPEAECPDDAGVRKGWKDADEELDFEADPHAVQPPASVLPRP